MTNAYHDPEFAERYISESRADELRDHAILDPLVRRALPPRSLLPESRILDVGCGDGRWSARLTEEGAEVVGVEPAAPMARSARERNLDGFQLVESPIEEAELDGKFDAILASMSLDHVADLEDTLLNFAGHLRPGGRLIVTTEHPLRTAPRDGVRWHDEDGDRRSSRVQDYGVEGFREYHWFGRDEPVRVFHRPMSSWLSAFRHAGLQLVALEEPVSDAPRDGGNPRFWLLVAEAPGKSRKLVTVDGPSAAGKSTFASALAREIRWTHLDSGRCLRAHVWLELNANASEPDFDYVIDGHELQISVAGSTVPVETLDSPRVTAACAELPPDSPLRRKADRDFHRLLDEHVETGVVASGRSLGRTLEGPIQRFYLHAAEKVRHDRDPTGTLTRRDHADRERGRLAPPDIDSIILDSSRPNEELVGYASRVVSTRVEQLR